MRQGYRYVLAGALLAWLTLPANAEVVLTTETMTGTGLPPGQALPASPQEKAATQAPFTPKTVTAEKMLAWGSASATTPGTTKPAKRRFDQLRPRAKEVQTNEKPVRRLP